MTTEHIHLHPSFEAAIEKRLNDTHEIKTYMGRVVVMGQCLEREPRIRAKTSEALASRDVLKLNRLTGSYSVLMAFADGEIQLLTDLSSQRPFYYSQGKDSWLISDTASSLGSQPNKTQLAMMIGCEVEPLMRNYSAYENVYRISGGQTAQFQPGSEPLIDNRAEIVPEADKTLNEAATELYAQLCDAIQKRLNLGKMVTSDCSGGVDSTLLALLAAYFSKQVIHGFIHHMPTMNAGDLPFAQAFTKDSSRLQLNELRFNEAMLPFAKLNEVTCHDEPDPATSITARIMALMGAAKEFGSEIHMRGDGGDAILNVPINYLTDLVHHKQTDRLTPEAIMWGRLFYAAPRDILKEARECATKTFSDELALLRERVQQPPDKSQSKLRIGSRVMSLGWIEQTNEGLHILTRDMREAIGEHIKAEAAKDLSMPENIGLSDYTALSWLRNSGVFNRHLRIRAAELGIETHAPFLDTNVAAACLSTPAYKRINPRRFKQIAQAFSDIVPPALLERRSKGDYTAEIYAGLRHTQHDVHKLLLGDDSRLIALGIIQPDTTKTHLQRQLDGEPMELQITDRLVATETWLRGQNL